MAQVPAIFFSKYVTGTDLALVYVFLHAFLSLCFHTHFDMQKSLSPEYNAVQPLNYCKTVFYNNCAITHMYRYQLTAVNETLF